ncbi:hypothetical protein ABIB17_000480 [Arthrobacter sp. UYEF6]
MTELREGDKEFELPVRFSLPESRLEIDEWVQGRLRDEFSQIFGGSTVAGLVMDTATVSYSIGDTKRSADDLEDEVVVKAKVIYRKPRRGLVLDSHLDVFAYRAGSSFAASNGKLVVNAYGVVQNIGDLGKGYLMPVGDEIAPYRPLWEPDEDMDWEDIADADYDLSTGMPARVMVALEDDIASSLAEGVL